MGREASEVTPSLTAGEHVAGYVIEERIGIGGFGEVFRARHAVIDREVAIKILHAKYSADPEAVSRFVAEAKAVSQISHRAIVDLFEFGKLPDGRQFCVMELVRGDTLREVLRTRGRLPLAEALPILRRIAEAVDAAHAAGIAHRDLKPDNVFVVDDGVKLIDFGLAKLTRDDAISVTQTGSVFGTPLYMSPEQCRGKAVTVATDAYSFGVVVYQVLTGELPFSGDPLELALHHLNDAPPRPSERCAELDDRVDRVVLALLAKDPVDRPLPLVPAIDAIVGDASLPAVRKPRVRWLRPLLAGGALVVLGGVAVAVVIVTRHGPAPDDACVPAAERLADVWDAQIRETTGARFAALGRVDATALWRRVAEDLDAYASRWATLWDGACHAADRKTDPLLHVQRLTCLDTALLQLRGVSKSLTVVNVSSFSHGISTNFVPGGTLLLDSCTKVEMLREQRPPPPDAVREEVVRLAEEFGVARAAVRVFLNSSGGGKDSATAGLGEMQRVADRLEALGLSGAVEAVTRAGYVVSLAANDPTFVGAARAAIADTIRRAEASHSDAILAGAYVVEGWLELARGGDTRRIEDAVAHAETAAKRAGLPDLLATLRAELDVRAGRLDHALELLAGDLAHTPRWAQLVAPASNSAFSDFTRARRFVLLARQGRHDQAIAEARELVAQFASAVAEIHHLTANVRGYLEDAFVRAGRIEDALAESDRRIAILTEIRAAPIALQDGHMHRMWYGLQLGRPELVAEARASAIRAGATPTDIVHDGIYRGRLELVRDELERMTAKPSGVSVRTIDDALASLDLMTGDLAGMRRHAERVTVDLSDPNREAWLSGSPVPRSPWLLAISDAAGGRRKEAEAALAKLAVLHESTVPDVAIAAHINDGRVLLALARWRDAAIAFEKVGAAELSPPDRAELNAFVGLSRLESGDPEAALDPLEQALDGVMTNSNGFTYYAPMAELALARALWATGGDKPRARKLAEDARDHFARLGTFKERDRQQAIAWLADHP